MARVAITGSTGFLGRHLLQALRAKGHDVVEILRVEDQATECFDAMEGCERLYHCAAKYNPKPEYGDPAQDLIKANVVFASLCADAAAYNGLREVVYCASPWQRGPIGLYGATKLAGQLIFESYRMYVTTPVVIGDTFGPGDTRGKVVQKLIEAHVRREPITVPEAKRINPIAVQYVADCLADGQHNGNLVGPPVSLETLIDYIRACETGQFLRMTQNINIDPNDPFPSGQEKYNQHYKTLANDLRLYVESYTRRRT